MRRLARLLIACATLAATTAMAAEPACFLSYEGFEEHVRHLDLDACPGNEPTAEQGFCRVALQGPELLVYIFRHTAAGPCLTRIDRGDFNAFVERHGTTYTKP
jgi:hypothetical protein